MPFYVGSDMYCHPKFHRISSSAVVLWVMLGCHCSRNLTDGFISDDALAAELLKRGNTMDDVAALLQRKLLDRVEGGYELHNYLEHNPSKIEVLADRRAEARRKKDG